MSNGDLRREIIPCEYRVCSFCRISKHRSEYDVDRADRHGIQGHCKECRKFRGKRYREEHPEYFKLKEKERNAKTDHKARYHAAPEQFKAWRRQYGSTLTGRLTGLLGSARYRSMKRGIEFTIDFDWLAEQYARQKGRCLLTGIEFDIVSRSRTGRKFVPCSPSLDRKDPSIGYTKENTRLVCTAVNLAMNHFGEEFFAAMCKAYLATQGL
jgi:hypothetical protein